MKRVFYTIALLLVLAAACKDDEDHVFDKSAEERAAEAIANLKQDLVAPAEGWKIKYQPQEGAGAFHVLLNFKDDGNVTIRSDLSAEEGRYFEETISYRIDNSMGLELIFANYSFFSFLFELDQASFGAEYELNYVNKTPDNALVFRSKTDTSTPSIILFEEASAADAALLAKGISANLNTLSNDFDKFTSSVRLVYANRDLALYVSMDVLRRTFTVTSASRKTNPESVQSVNFSTTYLLEGDSLILEDRLTRTLFGSAVSLKSLKLDAFGETSLNVCAEPITLHNYEGLTSENDPVVLETSLLDVNGKSFAEKSDLYFTPLVYIFNNGMSMGGQVTQDIAGAVEMHMYYGYDIGDGEILYGIGFVIQNADASVTFALREFTPVLNGNNIVFNFEPDISIFGNPQTAANIDNVNIYLDALTQGNNTYVFQLNDRIYEFHNPCTGWSFVFINANQ